MNGFYFQMGLADWRQTWANYIWCAKPTVTEKTIPDLKGKVYIVTGSTAGIGYEAAEMLASKGAKVYVCGRNAEKMEKSVSKILAKFPDANIATIKMDLSDLSTIQGALSSDFRDTKLHGIIHNAGTAAQPGQPSAQGNEFMLATNCIGPQLVQRYLDPILHKTAKSEPESNIRVVWLSSDGAFFSKRGGFSFEDMQTDSNLGLLPKYFQSKAINYCQAVLWAKKTGTANNVLHIAVHPGMLKSELARDIPGSSYADFVTFPTVNGAYTELFALLSPKVKNPESFIIPFGKVGRMRSDVNKSATGELGEELWKWLQEKTEEFYHAK